MPASGNRRCPTPELLRCNAKVIRRWFTCGGRRYGQTSSPLVTGGSSIRGVEWRSPSIADIRDRHASLSHDSKFNQESTRTVPGVGHPGRWSSRALVVQGIGHPGRWSSLGGKDRWRSRTFEAIVSTGGKGQRKYRTGGSWIPFNLRVTRRWTVGIGGRLETG